MITIRKANENDLDAVSILHQALYETLIGDYAYDFEYDAAEAAAALATQLKSRFYGFYLAEADGIVIGFVQSSVCKLERGIRYHGEKTIGRIDNIYVRPEARGTGAARELMEAAKGWMRSQELSAAESYIVTGNVQSLRFHEKEGFYGIAFRTICSFEN